MQGHDQTVVHGHLCHLQHHVPAQRGRLLRRGLAPQRRGVDPRGLGGRQLERHDVGVAVVGGDGAVLLEVAPALGQRPQVPPEVAGVLAGRLGQPAHEMGEARAARFQVAVGAERRDHPAVEARVRGECRMVREVVAGVIGRGEHVDPEALEQLPWPELVRSETLGHPVVDEVGGLRARSLRHAEDAAEDALHPEPAGSPAEQGPSARRRSARPPGSPPRSGSGRRLRDCSAERRRRGAAGRCSGPGRGAGRWGR